MMFRILLVSLFTIFFTTFSGTAFSQQNEVFSQQNEAFSPEYECPFFCDTAAGCEWRYGPNLSDIGDDLQECTGCACPSDQSNDCVPFAVPLDRRCILNGLENWFSKKGCWKGCINKNAVNQKLVQSEGGVCPDTATVDCDEALQMEFGGNFPESGMCGKTRSQCLKQFGIELNTCENGRCCAEIGYTIEECYFNDY